MTTIGTSTRTTPDAPVFGGDAHPLRLAVPKGRMHEEVVALLAATGLRLGRSARGYRPSASLPGVEVKILKPQNIVKMLEAGTRDLGFAGADWVRELGVEDALVEVLDTGFDPVRIVVAAPRSVLVREGGGWRLPTPAELGHPIRIASEMEALTRAWIARRGYAEGRDAVFVRTYGATEVFPPEDADCIVDVTATGATLEANDLVVLDEVTRSSTRLYASRAAMEDAGKRRRIDALAMLLASVLEARGRVMLEVNVDEAAFERVAGILPCMREPTVSKLHSGAGYALKAAVKKDVLPELLPALKAAGGTDIVITPMVQVVP